MKLLTINPFLFIKGFHYADVDFFLPDEDDDPTFYEIHKNDLFEFLKPRLEKWVNNDFDCSELDINIAEKLGHLFLLLEQVASIAEPKRNPYFEPKYEFDKINYNNEEVLLSEFLIFFVTILNSLALSYSPADFHLGKLDKLSEKDRFKRKKLTVIQKYVVIAELLNCFLIKAGITGKTAFNLVFHYIIMKFIDKSEADVDFLNSSEKTGILVSRGSDFLSRANYRSPVSFLELQNIYEKIKELYKDPEPIEEFYGIEANKRFLERPHHPPKRKRGNKVWRESFSFLKKKVYKNQTEMAKALGVSRQSVSAMKRKLHL